MMSITDNQDLAQSFAPAARTATADGASIRSGRDAHARAAILDLGLWTDGSHVFKLQRSDDDSIWSDVTVNEIYDRDDSLDTGLAATDVAIWTVDDATKDNVIHQVDVLVEDDYLRWVCTVGGGPANGLVSSALIQSGHSLRFAGATNPMTPGGIA